MTLKEEGRPRLLLASASPRRLALLDQVGMKAQDTSELFFDNAVAADCLAGTDRASGR